MLIDPVSIRGRGTRVEALIGCLNMGGKKHGRFGLAPRFHPNVEALTAYPNLLPCQLSSLLTRRLPVRPLGSMSEPGNLIHSSGLDIINLHVSILGLARALV